MGNAPPPDRGRQAWLVVVGGFLNFMVSFGMMNAWGVFQAHYETSKYAPSEQSTIPWIGSVQLFLMFIGGIVVGPAFDRWGARLIMIPGAIACIAAYIVTSFLSIPHHLLLSQGILFGIRNAMLYHPTMSSISEWFEENRALALGIAVSGSSVGGIIWPPVITKLLTSVGFPWMNRILGGISLPFLALSCLLVKERRSSNGDSARGTQPTVSPKKVTKSANRKHFLMLSVSLFFVFMGMLIPFYWIPLHALSNGTSDRMAPNLLAICYSGSFLGRIFIGWVADKFGRFNLMAASAALTGTLIFLWVVMTSFAGQVMFAVLFGFSSGGLIPLGAACVAQITPDSEKIGLRIGGMMAICSLGALAGGPVSQILLGTRAVWEAVFYFAGGSIFVGVLLLTIERYVWSTDHSNGLVAEFD